MIRKNSNSLSSIQNSQDLSKSDDNAVNEINQLLVKNKALQPLAELLKDLDKKYKLKKEKDVKLNTWRKQLNDLLEKEEEYNTKMEDHIQQQKNLFEEDLKRILEQILKQVKQLKESVNNQFDEYLKKYQENFIRVKDIAKLVFPTKSNDEISLYPSEIFMYSKLAELAESNDDKGFQEFLGQIKYCVNFQLSNLQPPKQKRIDNYIQILKRFVDEISKQILYAPTYKKAKLNQDKYNELLSDINETFKLKISKMREYIQKGKQLIFDEVKNIDDLQPFQIVSSDNKNGILEQKEGIDYCFRYSGQLQTDHNKQINSYCVISDYIIATASEDMELKIWKIKKNEKVGTLKSHKNRIISIAVCFNNNEQQLDEPKKQQNKLTKKNINIDSFIIPKSQTNGKIAYLASGDEDGWILVQCVNSLELYRKIHLHQDSVKSLISLEDDRYFGSGGLDKYIKIWDFISGKPLYTFSEHKSMAVKLYLLQSTNRLVSYDLSGNILIWKILRKQDGTVASVTYENKVKYLISARGFGSLNCNEDILLIIDNTGRLSFYSITQSSFIYNVELSKGIPLKDFLVIEVRELVNNKNQPFNIEELQKNLFIVSCSLGNNELRLTALEDPTTPVSKVNIDGLEFNQESFENALAIKTFSKREYLTVCLLNNSSSQTSITFWNLRYTITQQKPNPEPQDSDEYEDDFQ